jgi:hypothetical protein
MSSTASRHIFVPGKEGYTKLPDKIAALSNTGLAHHLNYRCSHLATHQFGSNGILDMCTEHFTVNVVYVVTDLSIQKLREEDVRAFMEKFRITETYNSGALPYIFGSGIRDRSFTIDFLARTLPIANPKNDGVIYIERFEVNLYFTDGVLTDWEFTDGLTEWSRLMKDEEPEMFRGYETEAKLFWKDDMIRVKAEINRQAEAFVYLLQPTSKNEFAHLHTNEYGNINLVMLEVCHHGADIEFEDFVITNYGRYKEVSPDQYQVGNFIYRFTPLGKLAEFYRTP